MRLGRLLILLILILLIANLTANNENPEIYERDPEPGSLTFWGSSDYDLDQIPDGEDFIAIATGDHHALALREDGTLLAWGAGTTNSGTYPHYGQSIIPTGNDFIAIAAGDLHSLALRSDGSLIAWGRNNYGQTDTPTGNNFVAIACGSMHSLALRSDGTLIAWGAGTTDTGTYPHYGQSIVPPWNNYIQISAGATHSLALRSNGILDAWGRNNYGQATVPSGNDYIAISANNYHNLALKADGSISAWGRNTTGQCNVPVGYTYISVAAGREHSLANRSDGSLIAWGMNSSGQCDVPDGNHYKAIAGGYQHSLAITNSQYNLISPNGGEVWQTGSNRLIRWHYLGVPTPLLLQYTQDNGASWLDIDTVDIHVGSYNWSVPTTASNQYKVRGVFNLESEEFVIESESTFTVTTNTVPSITLLTPTETGIRWQTGKLYEIIWNSNDVTNVDIAYSIDNGYTWMDIAQNIPATIGSYIWTVPDIPSYLGRILVQDSDNPLIEDISNNSISFVKLEILSDMSGLELIGGEYFLIDFSAFNSFSFRLLYCIDNGNNWMTIADDLQQTSCNWLIPNHNSDQVILRLEDYYDQEIDSQSGTFNISSLITLLSPIGGENFVIGSTHQIEWSAADQVTNVLLDYSIDNGVTWLPITIIPYPAATGSYEWLVPDTPSTNCLVKVKSVLNINSFGISNSPFTISDTYLIVTQPSGGEVWYPGSEQIIMWEYNNVEFVNLSYSYDGGVNWLLIDENINVNSSPYVWEIPSIGTMTGKVRVSKAENPMVYGISEGFFTIVYYNPPLNLTAEVTDDGVVLSWEAPLGREHLLANNLYETTTRHRLIRDTKESSFRWILEGYNLYRDGVIINPGLITELFYEDFDVTVGLTYTYFVTAVYDEAESEPSNSLQVYVTSISDNTFSPLVTRLQNNYPNPFNPSTTIQFYLAEPGRVNIEIFNNRGQKVKSLLNDLLTTGEHRILWDGRDEREKIAGSGIYFSRMQTNNFTATRKMILMK